MLRIPYMYARLPKALPFWLVVQAIFVPQLLSGCTPTSAVVAATESAPAKVAVSTAPAALAPAPTVGRPKVEVLVDEFTKVKTYMMVDSQLYFVPDDPSRPNLTRVGGSAILGGDDQGGAMKYYILYVTTETQSRPYAGFRLYSSATDASGATLSLQSFDRKVNCQGRGCDYTETGAVMINREYLKSRATSGIRMRLEGQRGTQILEVDGSKVTAFLDATNTL